MRKIKKLLLIFMIGLMIMPISYKVYAKDLEKVILIDPGHGGIDGGAKSKNGTVEKDINLSIAIKLKDELTNKGYKVYMTREEDIEISRKKATDLAERCKMKNDTKCDAFISIHQNMFPQGNCYGAQVWYADNAPSKLLAENVQNELKEQINNNNKRIAKCAKDQYKILRDNYQGACIIVECGFLSNSEEESKLKNEEYQKKIAESICGGSDKYFSETSN